MAAAETPKILLATGNPAKQKTLRWLLKGLALTPVTPQEIALDFTPEETADTHEAIARMKAQDWSRASSMLSIATDGGLVIPALGENWESLFTHRFAGLEADDGDRRQELLNLLKPHQGDQRTASWVEALAIADPEQVLKSWNLQGSTGLIMEGPGDRPEVPGFWFFSMWYFPKFNKTYNQLTDEEKASLDDHWAQLKGLVQGFFSTTRH